MNLDIKVQLPEVDSQIISVCVGSISRVQIQSWVKVHVIEHKRPASLPVVHVVGVRVLGGGHGDPVEAVRGPSTATEPPGLWFML